MGGFSSSTGAAVELSSSSVRQMVSLINTKLLQRYAVSHEGDGNCVLAPPGGAGKFEHFHVLTVRCATCSGPQCRCFQLLGRGLTLQTLDSHWFCLLCLSMAMTLLSQSRSKIKTSLKTRN